MDSKNLVVVSTKVRNIYFLSLYKLVKATKILILEKKIEFLTTLFFYGTVLYMKDANNMYKYSEVVVSEFQAKTKLPGFFEKFCKGAASPRHTLQSFTMNKKSQKQIDSIY